MLNMWWKSFRYLKREPAIQILVQENTRNPIVDKATFDNCVLPTATNRKHWDKLKFPVKMTVYRCMMNARPELLRWKVVKMPTLEDLYGWNR